MLACLPARVGFTERAAPAPYPPCHRRYGHASPQYPEGEQAFTTGIPALVAGLGAL